MSRFLKDSDYTTIIDQTNLNTITDSDSTVLLDAEKKSISKLRTKMVQRYDMDYELDGIVPYSAITNYFAGQRVSSVGGTRFFYVKSFTEWISTTQYLTGDIVKSSLGIVYTALQDSKGISLTSTSFWGVLVNIPPTNAPSTTLWSAATAYVVGNYVHTAAGLVYISIQNGTNQIVTNTAYWTAVIVAINSTYWVEGDNRYSLFIEILIDLTLYLLHARINPRNIPDLRKERNSEALNQLERWASGTDNAEIKELDVANQQGFSIQYGNGIDRLNNQFI